MTFEPVTLEHLLAHQGWALRVARQLVREEGEAEDLVQRTWMAAMRRPPSTARGVRSWIRKVILNLARERHRRDSTRQRHERSSARTEGVTGDAFEAVSRAEVCELLAERLLALDEPYRTVLTKRYYDDQSSVEIAAELGIPDGTVRWRLKVGLEHLREELDRRASGDRTRWVSALLLLLPPGELAPLGTREGPRPAGIGWTSPATWGTAAMAALAIGGLGAFFWSSGRASAPARARDLLASSSPESPAPDSSRAARPPARAPLAALPELDTTRPAAPASTLPVRVVDPDGSPVQDAALVVATGHGFEERARTDAAGEARITIDVHDVGSLALAAARGHVALRALAPGHVASELWHVAEPFAREAALIVPVGGPDFRLSGRVLDETGAPVAGAVVAWFDQTCSLKNAGEGDFPSPSYLSTESDAQGRFELAHLARGKECLFCFATGFAIETAVPVFTERAGEIELHLERGATLAGTVRFPGGRPAAGALLALEPSQRGSDWGTGLPRYDSGWRGFGETGRAGPDGSFLLEGLCTGARSVWARDEESGEVDELEIQLANGEVARWDAELAPRPGLRLRLVDENEQPLPGWFAHLRKPGGGGAWWIRRRQADTDGRVVISDCPDAELYLDVFGPTGTGSSFVSQRLRASDVEQTIRVETRRTSTLEGVLLDGTGAPCVGGELKLFSLRTAFAVELERDAAGRFALRLGAGSYALVLELGGSACKLAAFELAAGERRDLGSLRVPDPGNLRLSAAHLTSASSATPSYSLFALLDEGRDDRFLVVGHGDLAPEALLSLFPGRYRVLVFDGSGAAPATHVVRVTSFEETRLDL